LSPPISRATAPKSGKVATTLSLASTEKAHARIVERINKICFMSLKFVSAMRAEDEFPLKKDRIDLPFGEEKVLLQKIVIVLQSDL